MIGTPCLDEQLVELARVLRLGRLTEWERGFALSILGQAKRGGRGWEPSPKQARTLERILSAARPTEDVRHESEPELIDFET
jgi:hypothetical protein